MSTTEISTVDQSSVARYDPNVDSAAFLKLIRDAAVDPNVSVDKMERLMALKERFDSRQAEIAFSQAMARLQPTLPRITKHGRIIVSGVERSSYAKIEDIDEVIRPLYSAQGFSISWNTLTTEKGTKITGRLRHIEGHWEPYEITLPVDTSGSKSAVQGMGSTFSYGKRYLLSGMFNLITVDEDNDGQGTDSEPITIQQKNQILDLIIHSGANEKRFLEYMDVQQVEEITQGRFSKAINALKSKARK